MMKKALVGIVAVALVAVGLTLQAEKKDAPKLSCPVSGKAVNPKAVAAHHGGEVQFCCMNCVAAFKKDASKFAAKANHQLVLTGQAKQVNCPFAGKAVNASKSIDAAGVKVAFCCGGCLKKASSSDDIVSLVFNEKAFKKGFKVGADKE